MRERRGFWYSTLITRAVFQALCLKLMKALEGTVQVNRPDIAYPTDRVRVNSGEPRLYGTRFHVVEGRLRARPIEDPENVDTRREAMGLQSLEEYGAFMNT